jgi:hypothetical protein
MREVSRAFSASSSLSRLASLAFMPPYWATQRCHVDSATSRCRQRLLRTAQTGVGDDPVEQVTFGVREVFQQESVPFRERADSFLLSVELGAK